jgi:hypothetical protein
MLMLAAALAAIAAAPAAAAKKSHKYTSHVVSNNLSTANGYPAAGGTSVSAGTVTTKTFGAGALVDYITITGQPQSNQIAFKGTETDFYVAGSLINKFTGVSTIHDDGSQDVAITGQYTGGTARYRGATGNYKASGKFAPGSSVFHGGSHGAVAYGTSASKAAAGGNQLAAARAGTASYHDNATAVRAGYGRFPDAAGIACIDKPGAGGMGIHYVNGGLLDDAVNAATPEALVYEPTRNGRLRLVAAEYIAFQSNWDATHSAPPTLFGQQFELVGSPNRYGIPPFYELHAWLWDHNPRGMFDDWNPRVSCAFG